MRNSELRSRRRDSKFQSCFRDQQTRSKGAFVDCIESRKARLTALLRAATLRARGGGMNRATHGSKTKRCFVFRAAICRTIPPPVCARRSPCAKCSKKRLLKNDFPQGKAETSRACNANDSHIVRFHVNISQSDFLFHKRKRKNRPAGGSETDKQKRQKMIADLRILL